MRPDRLRWLLPPGVAVAGLVLAACLDALPGDLVRLYLGIDLAALIAALGVGSGLVGWVAMVAWTGGRRSGEGAARRRAVADRRRFLHRLDHELKNPLMAIRAATANLATLDQSAVPGGERGDAASMLAAHRQIAASIAGQATRLGRLATDLRKLADLETAAIERAPVDLAELLREVAGLARERTAGGDRALALTLPQAPWPLPAIGGDRDLLFVALYNLVDNAIKFCEPGDTIEMRAFEDGSRVVVEVADTGPGIPEGDVPFVWEELYRGRAARAVPGSGLGLALARAVAARHGAQIALRSRLGHGTVVTVRFPADAGGRGEAVTASSPRVTAR